MAQEAGTLSTGYSFKKFGKEGRRHGTFSRIHETKGRFIFQEWVGDRETNELIVWREHHPVRGKDAVSRGRMTVEPDFGKYNWVGPECLKLKKGKEGCVWVQLSLKV